MATTLRSLLLVTSLPSCALAQASEDSIVFIAPTNNAMPLSQFTNGQLSGGILMELGNAIAQRLGRTARFVSVPSKRVSIVLNKGEADGVCYVMPHWIDGDFNWSRPLIPNNVLLVAHSKAPPIKSLAALAGQSIGTVAGYRYPEMDELLGKQFVRDDAPTSELQMIKLAAGRAKYAIIGQTMFDYLRRHDPSFQARAELQITSLVTQCAFARSSKIPFAQVEKAINALADQGGIDTILSHYR